jgi:hypothetical protein
MGITGPPAICTRSPMEREESLEGISHGTGAAQASTVQPIDPLFEVEELGTVCQAFLKLPSQPWRKRSAKLTRSTDLRD